MLTSPEIYELQFVDQLCLSVDHFKKCFVKFANQNFPSVRIFVFQEKMKFLFTLQAEQFAYILLQNVLNYILFCCIWLLGLLTKFLQITSEKLIQTLRVAKRVKAL